MKRYIIISLAMLVVLLVAASAALARERRPLTPLTARVRHAQPTNQATSHPAYRQVIKNAAIWSANQDQVPISDPNSPQGTNLGLVTDFSTQLPFIDAFKMARPWIPNCVTTAPNCVLEVDENGWVTALPTPEDEPVLTSVTTYLLLGDAGGLNHVGGEYIVLYEGEGTIGYGLGASKNEAASIPGRDVVNVAADGFVRLRITETDPNHTGNYIRNIRFIRPQYEQTYETQPFNPVFLDKLANFSVLRFMPWMRTNDDPPGVWAERPQVDDYTYTTNNGVPLEVMLDLANRTQTAPWFNMPHTATDEYISEFATMVRDNLGSHLAVYVEYSNETWNGGFPQAEWVRLRGLAEFGSNNPNLGPYRAGLNWHGKRTAEMCDIWKMVWGEQSERVICVAASQAANSMTAEEILSCPLWTEGAPCVDHGIDALAIAPYFAGYVGDYTFEDQVEGWTATPDGGLDLLFTEIITGGVLIGSGVPSAGGLQQAYQRMDENKTVAEDFGVELIAYEGGQHLVERLDPGDDSDTHNEALTNLFTDANRDPRMGQIYSQYYTEWRERGGCLFVNFTLVQQDYNRFGSWGILEYINQESSPKYEAVMDFIDDNPSPWDDCDLQTTTEVIHLPFILNSGFLPDNCCGTLNTDSRSSSNRIVVGGKCGGSLCRCPSVPGYVDNKDETLWKEAHCDIVDVPPTLAIWTASGQAWLTGVGATVGDLRFTSTRPAFARLSAAQSPIPLAAQSGGFHAVAGSK